MCTCYKQKNNLNEHNARQYVIAFCLHISPRTSYEWLPAPPTALLLVIYTNLLHTLTLPLHVVSSSIDH